MKKPVFIDTSYLLALVNARDAYHQQACKLAEQIVESLITTEAVLTELANALAKAQSRSLAIETINDLRYDPEVEIVPVDSTLFSKALDLYASRLDKEWGLTDCISFVVMQDRKLKNALTADHHFDQAGFVRLLK